ncbi:MAG: TatD family hydrolase [Sebaldella sp.]|nr:TatD family hydrolase [Sebaldella sp.]
MNIDSHCHFDQLNFHEREKEISENIVIAVATGYKSGEKLLEYAELYPNLKVCLGLHPEYFENYNEYDLIEKQIRKNLDKISGIGEIGLPHFNLEGMEEAKKQNLIEDSKVIFNKFLLLAKELNLGVNLHCIEDSAEYAIQRLKEYSIKKALFHWFEGSDRDLEEIIRTNWKISISPDVLYNEKYRKFVSKVPLNVICLESDGPWEYNNKRGLPSMISETAELLAKIYNISKEEILEISNENSNYLFSVL